MQHPVIVLLSVGVLAATGHAFPAEREYPKNAVIAATAINKGPAATRNPELPLSPAKPGAMTAEEAAVREREKAQRNPMTVVGPAGPMGWCDPAGVAATCGTDTPRESIPPLRLKSEQDSKDIRWGTNTTVMTGQLAWADSACRSVSFDSDSAGDFYALVGRDTTSGNLMLYRSEDQGQTWWPIWSMTATGNNVNSSKLIVIDNDSLYFYCFYTGTNGTAGVWRLNGYSGGTNHYLLQADSAVAIAAAWDLDRAAPWFHVIIEKAGPVNVQGINYVRGANWGKTWTSPALVAWNVTSPSIAVGNMGVTHNNIFVGVIATSDSLANVIYDSSGVWAYQEIGGPNHRKEQHPQIAASHSNGSDSVRVWLSYTHWNTGIDRDINYGYNRQNAKGAWVKYLSPPGAAIWGRHEWGCSLNVPNWVIPGGINAMVELSYYSDSNSSFRVEQNWLTDGWNDPASWHGKTTVNDYAHTAYSLSYATRARRNIGDLSSVVLYPGGGPANVYFDGSWFTGVAGTPVAVAGPATATLEQNAPNPMSGRTAIRYQLRSSGQVSLAVYNIAGQLVALLVDGVRSAGRHSVSWDGRDDRGNDVATGVYVYRLRTDGGSIARKLTIVQ